MTRKHSVISIKESTREVGAGTQLVVRNIGAGKRKLNTANFACQARGEEGVGLCLGPGLTQGDRCLGSKCCKGQSISPDISSSLQRGKKNTKEKKKERVKEGGEYPIEMPKIMDLKVKEGARIKHSVNAVLRVSVDLPANEKHMDH